MQRMRQELERRYAKTTDEPTPAPSKEQSQDTELESQPPSDETPPETPQNLEGLEDAELPAGETPAGQPAKGTKEKVNPWRVMDQWKSRALTLEKELADLKTSRPNDAEAQSLKTRVEQYETKIKEMESALVLADYKSSNEFKEKFEQPYFEAYAAARKRVGSMKTDNGSEPAPELFDVIMSQPNDDAAASIIEELYGTGAKAATVSQMREQVLALSRNAQENLDAHIKQGAEFIKDRRAQAQKFAQQITEQISSTWDKANKAILADEKAGHLFKPREGDAEWNQRLAKGFELVDRAFSENASNPQLTPEQRASVVKRHAAVRNRAAAFGALRFEVDRLQKQVSELQEELGQYKQSEPQGGAPPAGQGAGSKVPQTAWERLELELQKRAH